MAHTVELLALIEAYPDAFQEPTEIPVGVTAQAVTGEIGPSSDQSSELMNLIADFPEAFAEPEQLRETFADAKLDPHAAVIQSPSSAASQATPAIQAPPGYAMALHQTVHTFGWGQVDVFLRYGENRLQSIWVMVGKSGTEVQSFCEAIARLTNKLLAVNTPILDVVKELRGIRGGDSEGLGPHRFLGLVDLFGKVLQEAPETVAVNRPARLQTNAAPEPAIASHPEPDSLANNDNNHPVNSNGQSLLETHQWVELSDHSAIASICPDCGAELQQVNGCSGGACVVCGYSSCS